MAGAHELHGIAAGRVWAWADAGLGRYPRLRVVFAALAGRGRRVEPDAPLVGSDEALALSALDYARPRDAGSVGLLAGVGATRAARALCALELEGLALSVPGGRYVRAVVADPIAARGS